MVITAQGENTCKQATGAELALKSNDPVVVHKHEEWIYEEAPRGVKVQLLTIGDIAVYGEWKGKIGEFYKGWHPVPKRNKKKEEALGLTDSA